MFGIKSIILAIGIGGGLAYAALNRDNMVKSVIEPQHPDLAGIFNSGNYRQYIDRFGTVSRAAFNSAGKRIGTQVGTYRFGATNGMVVEMTYLVPDADHPLGQTFDAAGNPMLSHTGPDKPTERTQPPGPRVS